MFTRGLHTSTLLAAVLSTFSALTPAGVASAQEGRSPFDFIDWERGPVRGFLGDVAEIDVPETCGLADRKGTKQFLEATENPVGGNELAVLFCKGTSDSSKAWFVVFSYDATGYVKDDEKSSLDAAAILETLQEGTEAGNQIRRRRGWEELLLLGWSRSPYYDEATNNLTWSTRVKSKSDTDETINHSVRLLGRGGVMNADLVASQEDMGTAVPVFDSLLTSYAFVEGQRYAEWKPGDKVAEYGLTALIAGGAGVAAAKLGLFGKAWKLILSILIAGKKAIVVLVVGIGAWIKKLLSKPREPKIAGAK
jgi:uncharacterized membrane-anchored protein